MVKSLGLRELNQGNIIKVELGNGETLRGCFYGKKIYKEKTTWQREASIVGNFLVVIDPVEKVPRVIDIAEYITIKKTTVKGIYATRFPKEVSAYLKKYVLAFAKQQSVMVEELKMQAKREGEDRKLEQLKTEGQGLDYEVDFDSLPVEQRVLKVFNQLVPKLGVSKNIISPQIPRGYRSDVGYIVHIQTSFDSTQHIMDRELGITPDFEYDGSYHPSVDGNFDLTNTAVRELRITRTDIGDLLKDLNGLKGIKVRENQVFSAYTGDYPNDGSLDLDMDLVIDDRTPEKVLEKAMNRLAVFIIKA